ncbi:MAG: leucine-rich repeat protein [Lachnospiraceae bacterium]|nr:leucine-rich repeat protein [Lachnospiraceae bacterium]
MKKIRKLLGAVMLILSIVIMQLPAFGTEAAQETSVPEFSTETKDGITYLKKYNGSSTSVVIPGTINVIETDAFRDNSKITSVVIPNSVTAIEPYAFWNCSKLAMVSIGTGLKEIGDFVFANCKSLASANIPANIERIGIYAFEDDVNLTDITIPINTMDIHETAFDGCYRLVIHAVEGSYPWKYAQEFYKRQQEFPEYEEVSNYDPNNTNQTDTGGNTGNNSGISGTGDGNSGDTADNSAVIVTEPGKDISSVHVVGNKAVLFLNGSEPTVYVGNGVGSDNANGTGNGIGGNVIDVSGETGDGTGMGTGIDENAGIDLPEGSIPKYTIVDGKVVADQAYYCNTDINYVVLPQTIKEIGQFAYARSAASSIILPEGIETISYGAFYHCDNLGSISIPQSVTKVEPKAFTYSKWWLDFYTSGSDNDYLLSGGVLVGYKGDDPVVNLPNGIRVIASQAFLGHDEITEVILPPSLTHIGEEAFYNCTSLGSVSMENTSVISISDRAFGNTAVKEILLPESIESIGISAFDDDCVISTLGTKTPVITHEQSAERLSNSEYRANAYRSNTTEVSVSRGDVGVNVSGLEGVSASLEGAAEPYYLYVTRTETSPELAAAINRAGEFLKDRSLSGGVTYDIELTDKSGITITRLGHSALTVALPVPGEVGNTQQLTVLTVDRNGQLEEIRPEIIESEGTRYIRFSTYHLSPFGIYGTGELLTDNLIITAENVLEAHAAPPVPEPGFSENLKKWAYLKRFRLLPAAALIAGGFVLILYKQRNRRKKN